MADERTRYFRKLRRLRRSARRWSVVAGTFAGTSAVLLPYRGLGWPDAIWAALTGASVAYTGWRWSDARELAAQPVPEPSDPVATRIRFETLIARFPAGRGALAQLRKVQGRARISGSSVVPAWTRLDRAVQTFGGLTGRLGGPAESAVHEARAAERTLRELGERTAAVERALDLSSDDSALREAHGELLNHFTQGVDAYEGLVGAAAGYVAQDGRATTDHHSIERLTEATDLLSGIADGLAELTTIRLRPTG